MIFVGGCVLSFLAPIVQLPFLGSALTFMLVYVWGRKNPHTHLQFLGLINFTAPWLPWVLLMLSLILGHDVTADMIGIVVGHIYYFLKWLYPDMTAPNRIDLLRTPQSLQLLFTDRDGFDNNINIQNIDNIDNVVNF